MLLILTKSLATQKDQGLIQRIAIPKQNYPEDKLSEKYQELILSETTGVFQRTPKQGFPQLRSYRLAVSVLKYICADQQSVRFSVTRVKNLTMLRACNESSNHSLWGRGWQHYNI
jgi:hypothetical protein